MNSATDTFSERLAQVESRERALKLSQLESLIGSINGIVWEAEPRSLRTLYVSPQAERILGYPLEQWLNEPRFWQEHRHPDDRERVSRVFERAAADGGPFHLEYRMVAADGRIVWLQDSVTIIKSADEPGLLRGVTLDITQQKQAADRLALAQKELVETSRQAGMAEIATGVLHNVGNVLNSAGVSASLLREMLHSSKVSTFGKLAALIQEHRAGLGEYLSNDPKGKLIPGLLIELAARLNSEQASEFRELDALAHALGHIKEIVVMQQSYARVASMVEPYNPVTLVKDAIAMNSGGFSRYGIELVEQFDPVPPVLVDKHRVLQILVNLLRNARQSIETSGGSAKRLTGGVHHSGNDRVAIMIRDTGVGIAPENLERIFAYGFTTKSDGHGFGLHNCALTAKEMGGSLTAQSDGPGLGAVFVLELPVNSRRMEHEPGAKR